MKRKTFIILTSLHAVFVAFAFLVYFAQYNLNDGIMAERVARIYAMSLFIPNIIGMAVLYLIYVAWLWKSFPKRWKIKEFNLHISYNIFFLSGLSLELFQVKSAPLSDSLFIVAELAAIFLAFVIIFNNKNKKVWKC